MKMQFQPSFSRLYFPVYSADGLTWTNGSTDIFGTTSISCLGQKRLKPITGYNSYYNNWQNESTIHIGTNSGITNQGIYSIAIGNRAGTENLFPSSIVINATANALENTTLSGLFIDPIRKDNTITTRYLLYNSTTKEVVYNDSQIATGAQGATGPQGANGSGGDIQNYSQYRVITASTSSALNAENSLLFYGNTKTLSTTAINVSSITIDNVKYNNLDNNIIVVGGCSLPVDLSLQLALAYSFDGINFKYPAKKLFNYCSCVEWNGLIWVAGGGDTTITGGFSIAYSCDGINWTGSQSARILIDVINAISWNGTVWVGVGKAGAYSNTVIYSYDGINWIAVREAVNLIQYGLCIAWNGSMFVAGGTQPINFGNNNSPLLYSLNGIEWNYSLNGNSVLSTRCDTVSWNGKLWVAGGSHISGNNLAYSYDGIKWVSSTNGNSFNCNGVKTVVWNGLLWVAGLSYNGGDPSQVPTVWSYDGITWSPPILQLSFPFTFMSGTCVIFFKYKWILFAQTGGSGMRLLYSNDGITWSNDGPKDIFGFGIPVNCVSQKTLKPNVGYSYYNNWQNASTIRIGATSGINQGKNAIAIGYQAGQSSQGAYSIAIGNNAGTSNMYPSSIIINATANTLQNATLSGLFIDPIRKDNTITTRYLLYNSTTKEVVYNDSQSGSGADVQNYAQYRVITASTSTALNAEAGLLFYGNTKTLSTTAINVSSLTIDNVKYNNYDNDMLVVGVSFIAANQISLAYSSDGITFTYSESKVFQNYCLCVEWNGLMWVAGGGDSRNGLFSIAYSYDGINWTGSQSATNLMYQIQGIAWNGTMWVAVGLKNNGVSMIYSYDGINWNVVSGVSSLWNAGFCIAWNGSIFVAGGDRVGYTTALLYSSNGLDWKIATNGGPFPLYCFSVAWNGKLWVAGGQAGSGSSNNIAYSYDGITWSLANIGVLGNANVPNVYWNGSVWTACLFGIAPSYYPLGYSQDGITWTPSIAGNAYGSSAGNSSIFFKSKWIAFLRKITSGGILYFPVYSADGLTWTNGSTDIFGTTSISCLGQKRLKPITGYNSYYNNWQNESTIHIGTNSGITNQGIYSIAIGNRAGTENLFPSSIVINATVNALENTTLSGLFIDPIRKDNTITTRHLLYNSTTKEVVYNDSPSGSGIDIQNYSQYRVITASTSTALNAEDGLLFYGNTKTLSTTAINVSSITIDNVKYDNYDNNMIVVGTFGNQITLAYSFDGITFKYSGSKVFQNYCLCVEWNGLIWVATGGDGGTGLYSIAYSYDGINWTGSLSATDLMSLIYAVAWNGTMWVAVGVKKNGVSMIYSYDGINWKVVNEVSNLWGGGFCIAWNGSMFVAGGAKQTNPAGFLYSSNGFDWKIATNGGPFPLFCFSVAWNGNLWVAGGECGGNVSTNIAYSSDGITWTLASMGTLANTRAKSVYWNGSLWIGCFDNRSPTSYQTGYSQNGINWAPSINGDTYGFSAVAAIFFKSRWIVFNRSLSAAWFPIYSTDGLTWTNIGSTNVFGTNTIFCSAQKRLKPITGYSCYYNNWQYESTIHIGTNSGFANQGKNAIAIGYLAGTTNQRANSIILNTSESGLENTTTVGLFINPVRNDATLAQATTVHYNVTTKELTYGNEASDARLKNNIIQANTEICYSTIESLPLRYFEWNNDFFQHHQGTDKHTLGFIAQEIQPIFPKSISIYSNSFLPDLHSLNMDQIYKSHIGATQQLMAIVKSQQSTIDSLVQRLV